MARSLTPFDRYLRVAADTKSYEFGDLVEARDFFRAIPLGQMTGQSAQALAELNAVVDGRYEKSEYIKALEISMNPDSSTAPEMAYARKVLRTIRLEDPRYIDALLARKRLLNSE